MAFNQLRLDIEKQAAVLSYFFEERRQDLIALRKNPALQNYFINRDLGMSIANGLGASLVQMESVIGELRLSKQIRDVPIYLHLAIFDESGQLLAESGESPEAQQLPPANRPNGKNVETRVQEEGDAWDLSLISAIPYKDRTAGTLVARIDHSRVFASLMSSDNANPRAHLIVGYASTPVSSLNSQDELLDTQTKDAIAKLLRDGSGAPSACLISHDTLGVHTHVPGTPFWLVGLYPLKESLGILPSPGFFIAMVFIAIGVLGGAVLLMRINTKNLVLQVRLEEWKRQESLLNAENTKLQEEITRRRESEEKLTYQANFDQLTGLPNRVLAIDRLSQAISQARRSRSHILVVFAGIDRFKQINDSLDHATGDQLLVQVADRLVKGVRASDTVARFGGDEFVLIFPDAHNPEAAQILADFLLGRFSRPFQLDAQEFQVSISLGLALYPQDGADAMSLLKNADMALHKAKDGGRSTFCFFTPSMNEQMQERLSMEANLRRAIERCELSLKYQPQVCFNTGEIVAFEALLRWNNHELGETPPSKFIPLAEESGLIEEIGAWVLERACQDAQEWQAFKPLRLAVNLSSQQMRTGKRFLTTVEKALHKSGLDPVQLELEVTESALLEDRTEVKQLMQDLDRLGVRLALDDFGTGYSALSYLKHFPFDVLKIDRSFVQDCITDPENSVIVRAILAMARALRMEVVGEGIETAAQAKYLHANRCNFGQGYHFSRPISPDQVMDRLEHGWYRSSSGCAGRQVGLLAETAENQPTIPR